MRILILGSAGFVGSCLTSKYRSSGHEVYGWDYRQYSPDLSEVGIVDDIIYYCKEYKIELVWNLAAEPIVKNFKDNPACCMINNFGIISNLYEVKQRLPKLRIITTTTDKVYQPKETPHKEDDPLGYTPGEMYSLTKYVTELICKEAGIQTVRAANIVGWPDGETYENYRLIPDVVKAIRKQKTLSIRRPAAIRPWISVQDACSAYQHIEEMKTDEPFNVASGVESTVIDMIEAIFSACGKRTKIKLKSGDFTEDQVLRLDASKLYKTGWKPEHDTLDKIAGYIVESYKL